MNFLEKLLLNLCYPPGTGADCNDLPEDEIKYDAHALSYYTDCFGEEFLDEIRNDAHALSYYTDCFGEEFLDEIRNRTVLDFGSGVGMQVIAAVKAGAIGATGIDIRESCAGVAQRLARQEGVSERVSFVIGKSRDLLDSASFDVVLSRDSFEHFDDPEGILDELHRILKPGGKVYITFGPLWYSPYGGHIQFMTRYPWLHLLFSEKTIINVRKLYRSDGARSFAEVEGGLNKMTVRRFRGLIKRSKFTVRYFKIYPLKKIPLIASIPFLGELFSPYIRTVLEKE